MQYTEIFFSAAKIENVIGKKLTVLIFFAQSIDCGYTFELPLTGGSHNLSFGSKIRKNVYTLVYPNII